MQESLTRLAAVFLFTLALAGCAAGRWFETSNGTPSPDTSASDPKGASATYIRSLCGLPADQRQSQVRALNEAVLPDNVVISCGRSGLDSR